MWLRAGRVWLCLCCAWLLALGGAGVARADMAPPEQLPGSDIGPGGATQVRMLAEQIVLDVQAAAGDQAAGETAAMLAQVRGRFTLRNLGEADEHMQARFPRGDPLGRSDGYGRYQQVQQFAVQVGGLPVATTVITSTNPQGADQPPVEWLAFDVDFPVGQDVAVDVSYLIAPTGFADESFGSFAYVLQTGAGWRDSIATAEIIVRLPYEATAENVRDTSTSGGRPMTPGAALVGNEVRWSFSDLEPAEQDDIFISVMVPGVWQAVADARAAAAASPGDVSALARLAAAYDAAISYHGSFISDEPHDPFVALSEQAYEQAIALEPGSAQLHAGYAALLEKHHLIIQAGYDMLKDDAAFQAVLKRTLAEISQALALDPHQQLALDTLADMQSMSGTPLDLPEVTPAPTLGPTASQTPAPSLTPAPTNTPAPQPTAPPAPSPTPMPPAAPATGAGWPALGGGALALIALAGGAYWLTRRRRV
jgi:cell division septation protein DedD